MRGEEAKLFLPLAGLIVFVATGVVCSASSTAILGKILEVVNRDPPRGARFSELGWHPLKYARLFRAYRRVCPGGKHIRQLHTRWLLTVIAMAFAAYSALGFSLAEAFLFGGAGCVVGWLQFRPWHVA